MNRVASEPKLNYSILLFATIFILLISRPISIILDGVGRNIIWMLFPLLILPLAGTWMSLQVSKRFGGTPLIVACGQITFRWLTPVLYLLYAILFMGIATYTIAMSGDFSARVLEYGDSKLAIIFGVWVTACTALFPIETLIRYSQVLMIVVIPIYLVLKVTLLMDAQLSWLQPLFNTKDMVHPLDAIVVMMCVCSPLATVTVVNRKRTHTSFRSIGVYLTLAVVITTYLVAMCIATFGIHTARKMEYMVYYGQSAVHLESFIFEKSTFFGSILLLFFKIVGNAFMMRCAALSLAQTFGARVGIIPVFFTGGVTTIFLWQIDLPLFFMKAPLWLGYYSVTLIVVFPALIYGILLLRGNKS
ncbi:MAG: hypothetical protein P0Y55_16555 [Candidatus Cohnella colombiensis]|uniref:Uncharacterized protein n=1 Tax=Candidatus Cohnella colombiensis TaxID=3121368 RepID=A0AA95EVE7_9BACL|nr:MAG: hypothetical protein P0Y55_16555 [Cohnella sp.]